MPITPPPQPPLPVDDQPTFDTKSEAWLLWQYNSASEFNDAVDTVTSAVESIQPSLDIIETFPASAGSQGKHLTVNAGGTGLTWADSGQIGDVSFAVRKLDGAKWVLANGQILSSVSWPELSSVMSAAPQRAMDAFTLLDPTPTLSVDVVGSYFYVTRATGVHRYNSSGGFDASWSSGFSDTKVAFNSTFGLATVDGNKVRRFEHTTFGVGLTQLNEFASGQTCKSIIYVGSSALILAESGNLYLSTDNGSTWTYQNNYTSSAKLKKVGSFAVILVGNTAHVSLDGTTWQANTITPPFGSVVDFGYISSGSGRFVFLCDGGWAVFYNVSGITLTKVGTRSLISSTNIVVASKGEIIVSNQNQASIVGSDWVPQPLNIGTGSIGTGFISTAVTGLAEMSFAGRVMLGTAEGTFISAPYALSGSTFRVPRIPSSHNRDLYAYIRGKI